MAVSFIKGYDDTLKAALYARFGGILGISSGIGTTAEKINKGVVQMPKEVALREVSEKRASDFLEFMSFYRSYAKPSTERRRTYVSHTGLLVPAENGTVKRVKAQSIDITYDVWFWSKNLDLIYQCIESYILWQYETPAISLVYDDLYELNPHIHFGEIVDESTVASQFDTGRYFVYRMPVVLDGWVLKSSDVGIIHKIICTLYDGDNEDRFFSKTLIYGITDVSTIDNSVLLPGDRVADFEVGDRVSIVDSTANDGVYTVFDVELIEDDTLIKFSELLVDDTVDGSIKKLVVNSE